MKKTLWLLTIFSLLLIAGSEPMETIRLTIINKSDMDIAVQLRAVPQVCINKADVCNGELYYLTVLEGSRDAPNAKQFDIEKNTYQMQLYYLETYDPVYGFKCSTPAPNVMMAKNNLRVTVLPCDQIPGPGQRVGERTMWKYLPFPLTAYARYLNPRLLGLYMFLKNKYWLSRLIY